MGQCIAQDPRRFPLLIVDVAEAFERRSRTRHGVQAVVVLKLPGELLFHCAARVGDKPLQAVASVLIESHYYSSPSITKETSISS